MIKKMLLIGMSGFRKLTENDDYYVGKRTGAQKYSSVVSVIPMTTGEFMVRFKQQDLMEVS